MKATQIALISICLLLASSLVAAQYSTMRRTAMTPNMMSGTGMMQPMVANDLVSFIKEKAKMKQLNLVFIDPVTFKQVTPAMIAMMPNDRIKEILASAHNAGVLKTSMNLMMAEKRMSKATIKRLPPEQVQVLRSRSLRTLVTRPVPRASVQGVEERIGRAHELLDNPVITDKQLDSILAKCKGTAYRGSFVTLQRRTDTFTRYLDVYGNPDREVLKRLINPSSNIPCVLNAIRNA